MGAKRLKSKEYEINVCKFGLNFQFSIPNLSSYDRYERWMFQSDHSKEATEISREVIKLVKDSAQRDTKVKAIRS